MRIDSGFPYVRIALQHMWDGSKQCSVICTACLVSSGLPRQQAMNLELDIHYFSKWASKM